MSNNNNNNFARQYAEAERIVNEANARILNNNSNGSSANLVNANLNNTVNNANYLEALRLSMLGSNNKKNKNNTTAKNVSVVTKPSGPSARQLSNSEAREVERYLGAGENSLSIQRRVPHLTLNEIEAHRAKHYANMQAREAIQAMRNAGLRATAKNTIPVNDLYGGRKKRSTRRNKNRKTRKNSK